MVLEDEVKITLESAELDLLKINKSLIPCFIGVDSLDYHVRGIAQTLTFDSHKQAQKGSHVINIDRVDTLEEGFLVMDICTPIIHTYNRPWIHAWQFRPVQWDINYGIQDKLDLTVAKKVH